MHARNLLNLALLAIIVLLIVLVAYQPGKEEPITPPSLTELTSSEITRITIKQPGDDKQTTIELSKVGNHWQISSPFKATFKANDYRIDSLLKLATTVSFSQNDLASLNKENFGLDTPYATITFNDKLSIIFGHNKSMNKHRYVQIGNTLHLITDTFYYQVAARAESFIDHSVLAAKDRITQIQLPGLELGEDNNRWRINPQPENFSQDQINKLVSEWQLSQAYDVRYSPGLKQQAKPDVIIHQGDKQTLFKASETKDDFILFNTQTGLEYILSKDRKAALLQLPELESSQASSDSETENVSSPDN